MVSTISTPQEHIFNKEREYGQFMDRVRSYLPEEDWPVIERAFALADKAHAPQKRASGEPYILHPLGVATILSELQIDRSTLVSALLHDVVEDTEISLEEIENQFGPEVAFLVDGVTKLNQFQYQTKEEQQIENYRKMILAMAKDVRVVVIKLGDRLHNMRTLKHMRPDKQQRIAQETLEIFAPLAHRLGIFNIKWELEDLSFRYLEPEKYYDLVQQMSEKRQAREDIVNDTMNTLKDALEHAHIKADVKGRPKHFYSIYKKMKKDNRDLSQIYDLYAVRVIVDTIPDCYAVLGTVHSLWKPLPYRFKDYIAMPKSNMYQSLHTTVIGTKGQPVEIQIRTWDMHRVSEYGVAAHWRYKEGNKGKAEADFDAKVGWIRHVLEWQDASDPKELLNALKLDVFTGEVFVFTPKGDVMKLPKGTVPLDFAYRVHTDVGNKCVGAKINGKIVPLDYELQNGDIVEIVTSKNGKPRLDWLNIVGSTESKTKIRNWFKRENKEENIVKGRELLEKEAKRLGYDWKDLTKNGRLEKIGKSLNAGGEAELYSAVGFGGLSVNTVLLRLVDIHKQEVAKEEQRKDTMAVIDRLKVHQGKSKKSSSGVLVKGEAGVMVRMARCCNPVPGDDIIGYITRGRGVSVHRADCTNIGHTPDDLNRMIEVDWEGATQDQFQVSVSVHAYDRSGLLMEVMAVLSEMKINISNINAKTDDAKDVTIHLMLDIKDLSQLDYVMTKLRRVKDVYSVHRGGKA